MSPHRWVPVALDLAGRRVVCIGAGPVAAGKLTALDGAGARVEVIAPQVSDEVVEVAADLRATLTRRTYRAGDLDGAAFVLAATATPSVNESVAVAAAAAGVPCVRADARAGSTTPGDAALLATIVRGRLTVAVGTSGAAPALTVALRAEAAERYDPAYADLVELAAELRTDPRVRAALAGLSGAQRRRRWRALLDGATLRHIRLGDLATAREEAISCLCSSTD